MTNTRFAKAVVAINCAVPAALLSWDALNKQLGADPSKNAIRTTGLMALIFLSLSLVITPLRKLSGWNWLVSFRRSLGLSAFFYAILHFSIYFVFDRQLNVIGTIIEIFNRPYLVIGLFGLLLMVPLAITSTNAMIKALGAKRWNTLHRLTYLAITAGVIHYYMQAKSDKRQPTAFIIAAAILLAYRVIGLFSKPRAVSMAAPAVISASQTAAKKPKFWTGQLRVIKTIDETPDVRTFRLALPDGGRLPFEHLPGQYLNVVLMIDGKRVNRSYTIASSPTRAEYCELTIKRENSGLGSRHIHDSIHQGDLLNVSAPAGRFTFTGSEANSIVLIGGGVGITPLMSVTRYLTDRNWPGDIYFIYSAKTARDLIFQKELEDLQRRHPNLHLTLTLTRADGLDWQGSRGRISAEIIKQAVPHIANQIVHICGPTEMMEPIKSMLRELGVAEGRIKSEVFQSPQSSAAQSESIVSEVIEDQEQKSGSTQPVLSFANSKKSIQVTAQTTVLEAAESVGVEIDYECRSGICGTCKTRLLSGRVQMETQDALSSADLSNRIILACQARPLEDVTVLA